MVLKYYIVCGYFFLDNKSVKRYYNAYMYLKLCSKK